MLPPGRCNRERHRHAGTDASDDDNNDASDDDSDDDRTASTLSRKAVVQRRLNIAQRHQSYTLLPAQCWPVRGALAYMSSQTRPANHRRCPQYSAAEGVSHPNYITHTATVTCVRQHVGVPLAKRPSELALSGTVSSTAQGGTKNVGQNSNQPCQADKARVPRGEHCYSIYKMCRKGSSPPTRGHQRRQTDHSETWRLPCIGLYTDCRHWAWLQRQTLELCARRTRLGKRHQTLARVTTTAWSARVALVLALLG